MNENQFEQNYYGVLAFQQSTGYSRLSNIVFLPLQLPALHARHPRRISLFNGIATNVTRESFLNGIQADGAYKVAPDHTLARWVCGERRANLRDEHATCFRTA